MPNNFRQLTLVILSALLLACHNGAQSQGLSKNINWQSLAFTCTHQQNLWPKPNAEAEAEAEAWFQQARTLQKKRIDADAEIIALYQQAAETDHIKAITNLGGIYRDGDGTAQSPKQAVALAERLIAMNIGVGYYQMGNYLEQGFGVKQDKAAAMAYYRKSADLGNPQGQHLVGDKLMGAFSASPDRDKGLPIAIKMLECALDQGHSKSGVELGYFYATEKTHQGRGFVYFQKAAALGNNDALFALYSAFNEGEDGAEKDPVRAACYKKLSDELGEDKNKTFPKIDKICPLPPKPMPTAS